MKALHATAILAISIACLAALISAIVSLGNLEEYYRTTAEAAGAKERALDFMCPDSQSQKSRQPATCQDERIALGRAVFYYKNEDAATWFELEKKAEIASLTSIFFGGLGVIIAFFAVVLHLLSSGSSPGR